MRQIRGLLALQNGEKCPITFALRSFDIWPLDVVNLSIVSHPRVRWTVDEWRTPEDTNSKATGLGVYFVDIPFEKNQKAPLRFTFFWTTDNRWEGRDYLVKVTEGGNANFAPS